MSEEIIDSDHLIAEGPFKSRTGNVMIAVSKSNTALTVIPMSLNGRSKSHTMGYKNKAASAKGQQTIRRRSHKMNVAIFKSLFK